MYLNKVFFRHWTAVFVIEKAVLWTGQRGGGLFRQKDNGFPSNCVVVKVQCIRKNIVYNCPGLKLVCVHRSFAFVST